MNKKTGQTDVFGELVYVRTYARWLEHEKRREKWPETVNRYRNYFLDRFDLTEEFLLRFNDACDRILRKEIVPSMRCMWTAGAALDEDNISGFNCTAILIDSVKSWADMLYLLMNGCGVGYSVERQVIVKLPEIPAKPMSPERKAAIIQVLMSGEDGNYPIDDQVMKDLQDIPPTIHTVVFEDSKLGWAEGLLEYMNLLYKGEMPGYDLSLIRPKGARLKTFGGKAGGSDDLRLLLDYLRVVFTGAHGRRLNSLECHDICCFIANVVVSAGIRRSACISLSNLSDGRMRDCKVGEFWNTHPQRQMCNNSVAYTEKPDMHIFMQEWMSLMNSGSGERGIFNRKGALKTFEILNRKTEDAEGNEYIIGTNPCCTGDTMLLTDEGHFPIRELVSTEVSIWNGIEFSDVVPFSTGENKVYHVELSNGVSLDCTGYHEWIITDNNYASNTLYRVKTTDLKLGDKLAKYDMPDIDVGEEHDPNEMYSLGFYAGDGNEGYNFSWVYESKYCCIDRLIGLVSPNEKYNRKRWAHYLIPNKFEVPINDTIQNKLEWLAGLLDSDGCIIRNPNSVNLQISSIHPKFLRDVRLMLTTMGVQCKVVNGKPEQSKPMPDGRGGLKEYNCKACERITISASDVAHLVDIGLRCSRLDLSITNPNRNASRFVTIVSVEDMEYSEETFCITETKNHTATFNGIVTGQCGEIVLRPNQACNLSEVIVRPEDTLYTLIEKVESATVLGCMQACLTHNKFLGIEWKENMEEERLLGVSMTGVRDHPVLNKVTQLSAGWLTSLRQHAHNTAKECAEELGINVPVASTTIKPSGTTSSLHNCASGIHTRFAPYYIRRIRISTTDVICDFLKNIGVPSRPEVGQDEITANTWVFEFPIKSPDDSVFDTSAIEQLEYWKMFKTCYTDHNPSVTITVEEDEWMEVGAWVYRNWDIVGGLSFLPKSNSVYQLMPFEAITKEAYEHLERDMPEIDFSDLVEFEREDETTGAQTLACTGNNCEIQ